MSDDKRSNEHEGAASGEDPIDLFSDASIRFAAEVMIRFSGKEAAKHAAARADDYLIAGNVEGHRLWEQIAKAIDEMQTVQPGEPRQ